MCDRKFKQKGLLKAILQFKLGVDSKYGEYSFVLSKDHPIPEFTRSTTEMNVIFLK